MIKTLLTLLILASFFAYSSLRGDYEYAILFYFLGFGLVVFAYCEAIKGEVNELN